MQDNKYVSAFLGLADLKNRPRTHTIFNTENNLLP